jgi:predicted glycosyltransferase involved in capsule biosynthesis
MEVPESVEGNLGMYIYDFFFEREESNSFQKEKQKESSRVVDPGYQPSPKKMKTQHERKDNSAKKIKKVVGSPKWCLVWEKTC